MPRISFQFSIRQLMLVTLVVAVFASILSLARPSPMTLVVSVGVVGTFIGLDMCCCRTSLLTVPRSGLVVLFLAYYATALSAAMLAGAVCLFVEGKVKSSAMPLSEFLSGIWLADAIAFGA